MKGRRTSSVLPVSTTATRQRIQVAASGPDWLTAAEVAEYLKVQSRTVLLWTRQGKIKAYALSGIKRRVWRYLRSDLDAVLLANSVVSSAPAPFVLSERKNE